MKKRLLSLILVLSVLIASIPASAAMTGTVFDDVPSGDWAENAIMQAMDLGIINGYPNGLFGYGDSVSRAEFAAMLVRLFGWEPIVPATPTFSDVGMAKWFYAEVETIAAHGAVPTGSDFRPNESITREEMAMMLVGALGYDGLASSVSGSSLPFTDVQKNTGYIAIAFDFGIINGTSTTKFTPSGLATREQAAAMMMRLYEKYSAGTGWLHAFYALSSYSQKEYITELDAVSFGWSRMEYTQDGGPELNTTPDGGNEFHVPSGADEVMTLAAASGVTANLNIYMSTAQTLHLSDGAVTDACREVLLDKDRRTAAIGQIITTLSEGGYSGVTIDFEGLRGAELKAGFNAFIKELAARTDVLGLFLYVCVNPATSDGIYYDGYDYRTLGQYADKVILMAHDYEVKSLSIAEMASGFTTTPVTPIAEVYTALRAVTDPASGVQDLSKVALALSFNSCGWTLQNGTVIESLPMRPLPSRIYTRLCDPATTMNYSETYQNPYITYYDESDNTDNIVWYEDARSVRAKLELARMFGVNGVSVWRLGLLPDYNDPAGRAINYNAAEELFGN